MLRFVLAIATALVFPLVAAAQPVELVGGERLTVVSKRAATGTHLTRATVEERPLRNGGFRKLAESSIAAALQACPEDRRRAMRVVVSPLEMPDRIGHTKQRLEGAGLYVSLPESGYETRGTWYLAPYAAQRLELMAGGSAVATVELRDFQRYEFDRDLLGKMDFLTIQENDLVASLEPFIKAQYGKAAAQLAKAACG